ncbi:MAG: SDR family oxidoreductase [Pseudomonadales bacterium]|nr:SDR family oxidoreductase [Pseudomonadales bacterium]
MKVQSWLDKYVPDLTEKRVLITGANSGIGYEAARLLASKHAEVILACRNQKKGRAALAKIIDEQPNANVTLMEMDLCSLSSVKSFSDEFISKYQSLDVLINNAGVMAPPYQTTEDGFELQFGTNHLGHFALTGHLLKPLINSGNARVVNLSSIAHYFGFMRFGDLNHRRFYERWVAYGQSKISNLYFTYELNRRMQASNLPIISLAAHPGLADTNLANAGLNSNNNALKKKGINLGWGLISQSAEMGALPTVIAAAGNGVSGGDYFGPSLLVKGYPHPAFSTPISRNVKTANRLWQKSIELTGVDYTEIVTQLNPRVSTV